MTTPAHRDKGSASEPGKRDDDAPTSTRQLGGVALEAGALSPGDRVAGGTFEIEEVLGKGGMTTVYLAHTTGHPRTAVALKVASGKNAQRDDVLPRMRNEAQIGAALGEHPNLVRTLGGGVLEGGAPFVATEFVRAPALADELVMGGPLAVGRAVRIARDVGRALQMMHAQGIVHRDVKPGNILVLPERAMLLDLGLAVRQAVEGALTSRFTAVFERPGTKHYMSPEQAAGVSPTPSMDVWSLGASLAEMLVGAPPHGSKSEAEAVAWKLDGTAQEYRLPRTRKDVPEALAALVDAALVRAVGRRITLDALLDRLTELQVDVERSDELAAAGERGFGASAVLGQVTSLGVDAEHGPGVLQAEDAAHARTRASLLLEIHRREQTAPHGGGASTAETTGQRWWWRVVGAVAVLAVVGVAVVWRGASVDAPTAAVEQVPAAVDEPAAVEPAVAEPVQPTPKNSVGPAVHSPEPTASPPAPAPARIDVPSTSAHADTPAKPQPKPAAPAPKLTPEAKPPAHESAACVQAREAVVKAQRARQHADALRLLARRECWPTASAHTRLMIESLMQTQNFAGCVKAAKGARDPAIVERGQMCAELLGVESKGR